MRLGSFGENIDVQGTIGQQIGEFKFCGRTDAAALPMVVDDTENLVFGRRSAHGRFPLRLGLEIR